MKILIVDDSRVVRRTIVKVVKDLGQEALEAENGAEALAQLKDHVDDIALIILDWNMPVMNGYQVLAKIRADNKFDQVPILMATSDGVASDVKRAIGAGADDYLVKPFTKEIIAARIAKFVPLRPAKESK